MSARFVVPYRSSRAPLTSGSSSISSWTISSLEIVAAPWRPNARSASLFPAPMPPVIATLSGFFGFVALGLVGDGLCLCDRLCLRDGLRFRDRLFLRRGLCFRDRLRRGGGLCLCDGLRLRGRRCFRDGLTDNFGRLFGGGVLIVCLSVRDSHCLCKSLGHGRRRLAADVDGRHGALREDLLRETEVRRELTAVVRAVAVLAVDALHGQRQAPTLCVDLEDQHLHVLSL